jgi:hypothetical protein
VNGISRYGPFFLSRWFPLAKDLPSMYLPDSLTQLFQPFCKAFEKLLGYTGAAFITPATKAH